MHICHPPKSEKKNLFLEYTESKHHKHTKNDSNIGKSKHNSKKQTI